VNRAEDGQDGAGESPASHAIFDNLVNTKLHQRSGAALPRELARVNEEVRQQINDKTRALEEKGNIVSSSPLPSGLENDASWQQFSCGDEP
jgi:hypothetical protein